MLHKLACVDPHASRHQPYNHMCDGWGAKQAAGWVQITRCYKVVALRKYWYQCTPAKPDTPCLSCCPLTQMYGLSHYYNQTRDTLCLKHCTQTHRKPSLTTLVVVQERAAAAQARILQENAARQKREELEMQQLEQRRSRPTSPLPHEPGDRSCCCLCNPRVMCTCKPQQLMAWK